MDNFQAEEFNNLEEENKELKKDLKVMREIIIDMINPDKGNKDQEDWTEKHIDAEFKRRRGER